MTKKIHIATSPLTGDIYAGHLIKNDSMLSKDTQVVTNECIIATVEHCLKFGSTVQITKKDGTVVFEINVKDFRSNK